MSDESLFREVEEELRREKLDRLWKRYGNLVIGGCIAIVATVSAVKGWEYWQRYQAEQAGFAYFKASELLTDDKPDEAEKEFQALRQGSHSGFARIAELHVAAGLAGAGKRDDAIEAYDKIVADGGFPRSLRDTARIRAGYLLADTASAGDLKTRLAGLDGPTSPWRNAVREIMAIAAYREGDYQAADGLLIEIMADPDVTHDVRRRAEMFSAILRPSLKTSLDEGQ